MKERGDVIHERADPAVTELLRALSHPLHREIAQVRAIMLEVDPSIREGVKWKSSSFRTTDYFATIHLRSTDRLQLVFHTGAKIKASATTGLAIDDPTGLIRWLAKDRGLVTLGAGDEIEAARPAFEDLVRAWIRAL